MARITHQQLQELPPDAVVYVGRVSWRSGAPGLHGWDSVSGTFETPDEAIDWTETQVRRVGRAFRSARVVRREVSNPRSQETVRTWKREKASSR